MRKFCVFLAVLLCLHAYNSKAQQADSAATSVKDIPSKYYAGINKKVSYVDEALTKKSIKYVEKLQKQERKLQQKMQKLDSLKAINTFAGSEAKYTALLNGITSKVTNPGSVNLDHYSSYVDTLSTSLSFLKKYSDVPGKLNLPIASLDELKSKLNQSEQIKAFIAERKQQIMSALSSFTKMPGALKNQYERLNKTAYYYSAQVKEYKDMLKDPDKMEKKALSILTKLPAFQKFMKQNSQLASMFPQPDASSGLTALAGLQTRNSIQAVIQQRIASGGPNAMSQIKANLAAGYADFNKLKDKINGLGGGSGDLQMPDFKPNNQKVKPFLQRFEYSADMQFDKSSRLLPSGANLGLGIGYKLNDKSTAGVGLSYKIGMGTIQHISFTSQSVGLRSYMDWKIKKQFYVTGGYEMNYNTAFKNIEQLKDYNAWQRSELIGVSKKYQISKKVKGEMKVLYDFLANRHIPVSQAVIFRMGYNF